MPVINTALTLKDLPTPPPGKTGWPWTEQSQPLPERMPDGSEWPKISIVTPSYNYGQFIEETIRSVLLQGYPNLEYIIIDGGSKDNTVEIIGKYDRYLTCWVSQPDEGQTDAINKGYNHCTGDIFAWLNADDAYAMPTCLQSVAEIYKSGCKLIVGECRTVDFDGNEDIVRRQYGTSQPVNFYQYLKFWSSANLPQPAVFVATEISKQCFPLDKNIYSAMDYQFFLRVLSQNPPAIWVERKWVNFKYHGDNKTMGNHPEYFDVFTEFYKIALSEAIKLPFPRRKVFKIELEDYKIIYYLMNRNNETPKYFEAIAAIFQRPTLGRWPLFWKVFLKALLGSSTYSSLKKFLGYS